jgi:hypothetical protein
MSSVCFERETVLTKIFRNKNLLANRVQSLNYLITASFTSFMAGESSFSLPEKPKTIWLDLSTINSQENREPFDWILRKNLKAAFADTKVERFDTATLGIMHVYMWEPFDWILLKNFKGSVCGNKSWEIRHRDTRGNGLKAFHISRLWSVHQHK